ncbi:DNA polymerase beta-like [Thrips palmi]|uniref:DNA polymerase n=1 Tax=Thrips palmi TaxID=161013 RepID=A0A6P8ZYE5_THRPL|nr:DNA polymerase beta-like [Thrips palmi]
MCLAVGLSKQPSALLTASSLVPRTLFYEKGREFHLAFGVFIIMSKRKNPATSGNLNHDICDFLSELANYEKNVNRNIHKYNAYRKAASAIASHSTRLTSGEEARKLDGVGQKISDKINEFLSTGKLQKLEKIHSDDTSTAVTLLTRVSGIGPAKAKELVNDGIRSIEDLESHKEKLNHHQLIGLKYFNDFEVKIPRSEIEEIEAVLVKKISDLDSDYIVTICGSYRRGKSESGDIDALITHPSFTSDVKAKTKSHLLKDVTKCLEECGLICDTLSHGDVKFMGACRLSEKHPVRRLDIRLTPQDQYWCSILYFTGSDMFNKEMRTHALQKGYTLNEYSLRPLGSTGVPGEPVFLASEKDIFEYIDYPYKGPDERSV